MPLLQNLRRVPYGKIMDWAKSMEPGAVASRGALGGLGGYTFGKHVTPGMFGYEDNPKATNMSAFLDALTYAGAAAGAPELLPAMKDPRILLGTAAGLGATEVFPVGMNLATKGTEAVNKSIPLQESAQRALDNPAPLLKDQLSDLAAKALANPAVRGAGMGVGVAGLGALLSGMLRSKSQEEIESGKSRTGMIASDFAKYVLPAMLAGGVINSLRKPGAGAPPSVPGLG